MADEQRMAEAEVLFREVNEGIKAAATRFRSVEAEFVCECGDAGCVQRVTAPLTEYEHVRSEPNRFLLAPGHEAVGLERVVQRRRGYWVVEKVERTMRRIAERFDPRAGGHGP